MYLRTGTYTKRNLPPDWHFDLFSSGKEDKDRLCYAILRLDLYPCYVSHD
jgi:hypothetical protein